MDGGEVGGRGSGCGTHGLTCKRARGTLVVVVRGRRARTRAYRSALRLHTIVGQRGLLCRGVQRGKAEGEKPHVCLSSPHSPLPLSAQADAGWGAHSFLHISGRFRLTTPIGAFHHCLSCGCQHDHESDALQLTACDRAADWLRCQRSVKPQVAATHSLLTCTRVASCPGPSPAPAGRSTA